MVTKALATSFLIYPRVPIDQCICQMEVALEVWSADCHLDCLLLLSAVEVLRLEVCYCRLPPPCGCAPPDPLDPAAPPPGYGFPAGLS